MAAPLGCPRCGSSLVPGSRICRICGSPAPDAGYPVATGDGPTGAWPAASQPTGAWPGAAPPTGAWPAAAPPTGAWPGAAPPTGAWPAAAQPTGAWPGAAQPPTAFAVAPPPGGEPISQWRRPGGQATGLTAGDWAGAAQAALGGLAAMVIVATIGYVLAASGISDLSNASSSTGTVSGFVPVVAMLVSLAMGGSLAVVGESTSRYATESASASLSVTPLGVTVAGLVTVATLFVVRLRTTGTARPRDAVWQGLRVAAIWAGGLLILALVGRWRPPIGDSTSTTVHITTNVVATIFFGFLWLAFTLTVAICVWLPHLLPSQVRLWRDLVGGAVAGTLAAVATAAAVLTVAALIVLPFQLPSKLPAGTASIILGDLALMWPSLLGTSGVSLGVPYEFVSTWPGGTLAGLPPTFGLLDLTDRNVILWLAPIVALAALVGGGVLSALHAPSPTVALRHAWLGGPVLALVLLTLAVSSSVRFNAVAQGTTAQFSAHLDYGLALLLGLVWGAVSGYVGALLAPRLPPSTVMAVQARVARARRRPFASPPAAVPQWPPPGY